MTIADVKSFDVENGMTSDPFYIKLSKIQAFAMYLTTMKNMFW